MWRQGGLQAEILVISLGYGPARAGKLREHFSGWLPFGKTLAGQRKQKYQIKKLDILHKFNLFYSSNKFFSKSKENLQKALYIHLFSFIFANSSFYGILLECGRKLVYTIHILYSKIEGYCAPLQRARRRPFLNLTNRFCAEDVE